METIVTLVIVVAGINYFFPNAVRVCLQKVLGFIVWFYKLNGDTKFLVVYCMGVLTVGSILITKMYDLVPQNIEAQVLEPLLVLLVLFLWSGILVFCDILLGTEDDKNTKQEEKSEKT